jgi:hypothetical protein
MAERGRVGARLSQALSADRHISNSNGDRGKSDRAGAIEPERAGDVGGKRESSGGPPHAASRLGDAERMEGELWAYGKSGGERTASAAGID